MIAKRIIPCLDVRAGRVVKGVNFEGLRDVDDPVALAARYDAEGADELVFYDITASVEERDLFTDVLRAVAKQVFIPLTVGGGIRLLSDFERVLNCGADKVSVNTGALADPKLIGKAARRYGSQCVVLSMDVKRVEGEYHVFSHGGRFDTGRNAVEWAQLGAEEGAGELVINSMDADGVKKGFDLPLLQAVAEKVPLPLIASGGAGKMADFDALFKNPGVDAGLAASIFHYRQISIPELKRYLAARGLPMRITAEMKSENTGTL